MHFFLLLLCTVYSLCASCDENKLFVYKCLMTYELVQKETASSTPAKTVGCVFITMMASLYWAPTMCWAPCWKSGQARPKKDPRAELLVPPEIVFFPWFCQWRRASPLVGSHLYTKENCLHHSGTWTLSSVSFFRKTKYKARSVLKRTT